MENDTEVIRQQMADTRNALSEKVEAVEELVSSAVKETAHAVTKTVETVTNSVENTVNTVSDSVESVKDALSDSVESVKEAFNVSACVEKYPWGAMAGSVALGYTLGLLLSPPKEGTSTGSSNGTWGAYASSPPASTGETASSSSGSFLSSWAPIIEKVKGLAVGSAAGLLGEMVMNMVPDNLKSEVSRLIDDTTRNLGGTIVRKDYPDSAG